VSTPITQLTEGGLKLGAKMNTGGCQGKYEEAFPFDHQYSPQLHLGEPLMFLGAKIYFS